MWSAGSSVSSPRGGVVSYPHWKANSEETDEHRRYPRLECGGVADIRIIPMGERETGCLVNISKRGCCFLANEFLHGETGCNIEVHLKVRGIDLRVAGIIRHVHRSRRAGIEFLGLSDRKREQIEELIAELMELDKSAARSRAEARKLHADEYLS